MPKILAPDAATTILHNRLETLVKAIKRAETPAHAARLAREAEKVEGQLRRRENVMLKAAGYKRCCKCEEVKECAPKERRKRYQVDGKPLKGFYRDSAREGGWASWCKACMGISTKAAKARRQSGLAPAWKHRSPEERELDRTERFMSSILPKVPPGLLIQPDHLWCKECNSTLLASDFPPDKRTQTGKKARCIGCQEKYEAREKLNQ